jgi:hypothetical protein
MRVREVGRGRDGRMAKGKWALPILESVTRPCVRAKKDRKRPWFS